MAKSFLLLSLAIILSAVSLSVSYRIGTTQRPIGPKGPPGPSGPRLTSPTIASTIVTSLSPSWKFNNQYFETDKVTLIAGIVAKLAIFLYSCLAIALMCDEFFVPALELIGKAFSLPSDITGAILIPLGTSGPEIFSSAISVFFTANDIGTGAIIGSAVFNLLAIPASCGIAVVCFIGKPIKLDSKPILRDLVFYIITIIVLILVIKDNRVDLIDASLLVLMAALYIGTMIYNANVMNESSETNNENNNNTLKKESTPLLKQRSPTIIEKLTDSMVASHRSQPTKEGYGKIQNHNDPSNEDVSIMNNRVLRWILMPMSFLFWITMPKRWVIVTFFFSIAWLSGLSYVTVWSISGVSESLKIPYTISGMTILAAGSAVPDLVTSVIVIRKSGAASMGICAAVASNIFAIVFGLGLPWFIQCIIKWSADGVFKHATVIIQSDALPYTSIILLLTIFGLMATLKLSSWRLFKKLSLICALIHVAFLGAAITLESCLKKS